jgi:hypothetical protein
MLMFGAVIVAITAHLLHARLMQGATGAANVMA